MVLQAAEIIYKNGKFRWSLLSSYSDEQTTTKTEIVTSYGHILKKADDAVLRASLKMAFLAA